MAVQVVVTTYDKDDLEVEVTCSVTPAVPARGWDPGDPGELEILSAIDEQGHDRRREIERDVGWWDEVDEEVMKCMEDDDDRDRAYEEYRDRFI